MFSGFVGFTAIDTSFCAPGVFVTRYWVPNGIVPMSVPAARITGGGPAVTTPDIGTESGAGRGRIGAGTEGCGTGSEAGDARRGSISARAVAMRTMCEPPVPSPPTRMDAFLVLESNDGCIGQGTARGAPRPPPLQEVGPPGPGPPVPGRPAGPNLLSRPGFTAPPHSPPESPPPPD